MTVTRQRLRAAVILFSFFLFPVTYYYFSPYLIIQATLEGVINGSLLLFGSLFLLSLFLGRAFCGCVCPAAGAQEALFPANFNAIRRGRWLKWVIWVPWISSILLLVGGRGGYTRIDPFYQTVHGISVSSLYSLIVYLLVLLLVTLPALWVGRRSFCHHICWMAPFMILGRRLRNALHLPALALQADGSACSHCHTCLENCPMSIPVESLVHKNHLEHSDCILCGTCVDGCESVAIRYRFTYP